MTFIPYGKQSIDQNDINAVVDCLQSPWLTQGPAIKAFEDQFSHTVGSKFSVAVSNGTAALHLSLLALGIGPGDDVITTPNSFLATSNAILYVGATPIFVDIEPLTFNIDPTHIEAAITPQTKAIIPVHFAGSPVHLDAIHTLAKKHNLLVIEDACHALGSTYNHTKIGDSTFSNCCTFSFHPVKHIATGEGGMVTTNSKAMYKKLLELRTHGVTKDADKLTQNPGPWYYEMQSLGFNYRMTDIQATLGLSQLAKLSTFVKKRQSIAKKYDQAFESIDWIEPISTQKNTQSSYHLYVVQLNFNKMDMSRTDVMQALKEKGIGTQVHYIPIYKQPYYKKRFPIQASFPTCERYYSQALSLPMYPSLSDHDQEKVISHLLALA